MIDQKTVPLPFAKHQVSGVRWVFCFVLFINSLFSELLYAQQPVDSGLKQLTVSIKESKSDSSRIDLLYRFAYICYYKYDDNKHADSLASLAINIAKKNSNPRLLLTAYNNYLESNSIDQNLSKALRIADLAITLCEKTDDPFLKWRTYHNHVAVCMEGLTNNQSVLKSGKLDVYSKKALDIARKMRNDTLKVLSIMDYAKSLERNNNIEAFRNYLNALDTALSLKQPNILKQCYSELSRFYLDNGLSMKARSYVMEIKKVILNNPQGVDSVALMWATYDYQTSMSVDSVKKLAEADFRKIIDFALRHQAIRLKNRELALYRTCLIKSNQQEQIYTVYHSYYPKELNNLNLSNPILYCRLQAMFCEFRHQIDSAIFYLNKAESLLAADTNSNKVYFSNFYRRYGDFLMDHGFRKDALIKYRRSYEMAELASQYYDYMLIAAVKIKSLFEKEGDFKNAYIYSELSRTIQDTIAKQTVIDKYNTVEIERIIKQKENDARIEKQKRFTTIIMFSVGILFMIIFLLLIYRNFRIQKRYNKELDIEKNKSDELLLNILPFETAEELKRNGSAKAQKFSEVTVMFTDFRNFTQASEQMNPDELVNEIHYYFSEFDHIITKHNIEKIKIIGDSYMCAGGLPVSNTTHAFDVISAALEMQNFMASIKETRIRQGRHFFELRIGINTGPVIAGIVGTKKFAYDIWGDTVNTASRMENSGAIDKVNISGATYEKIKDKFSCTYRGKVEAKHKGMIDMYFVECLAAVDQKSD